MPDRGPAAFAVTTATLALATVFVAARMVCRYFIVQRVSWDDKIMLLAWLIAFFLSFSILYGVTVGLGNYDADIGIEEWPKLRRAEYVFSILYNPALMATKTSILIFYLRLAKNTQIVLRYASWATLVVVNINGTVLTLMNIFQCRPISAAWQMGADAPTCIPLLTEFICAAPVNIVTDLAILALPIPVLTGMRLPSRQKTILVITFTLGVFVTIVDVVRIYYLQKAITDTPTTPTNDLDSLFGDHANFAWNASLSFMWSAVEVNIGMICACIPTLQAPRPQASPGHVVRSGRDPNLKHIDLESRKRPRYAVREKSSRCCAPLHCCPRLDQRGFRDSQTRIGNGSPHERHGVLDDPRRVPSK